MTFRMARLRPAPGPVSARKDELPQPPVGSQAARRPPVNGTQPQLGHSDDQYRVLMRRYQAGDPQGFDALFRLLARDLPPFLETLRPCNGHDPACLDEVFLAIHHARRSYDPRRPFGPWVTAIARHVTLSRHPPRVTRPGQEVGGDRGPDTTRRPSART